MRKLYGWIFDLASLGMRKKFFNMVVMVVLSAANRGGMSREMIEEILRPLMDVYGLKDLEGWLASPARYPEFSKELVVHLLWGQSQHAHVGEDLEHSPYCDEAVVASAAQADEVQADGVDISGAEVDPAWGSLFMSLTRTDNMFSFAEVVENANLEELEDFAVLLKAEYDAVREIIDRTRSEAS